MFLARIFQQYQTIVPPRAQFAAPFRRCAQVPALVLDSKKHPEKRFAVTKITIPYASKVRSAPALWASQCSWLAVLQGLMVLDTKWQLGAKKKLDAHKIGCSQNCLSPKLGVHKIGCSQNACPKIGCPQNRMFTKCMSPKLGVHKIGCSQNCLSTKLGVHKIGCSQNCLCTKLGVHKIGCSQNCLSTNLVSTKIGVTKLDTLKKDVTQENHGKPLLTDLFH